MGDWQTLSSKVVYENPWMTVHEDKVVRPDGTEGTYGVVKGTHDGVFIVPVDDEGNTYLVHLYRYTTKHDSWECPAGGTDGQGIIEAAHRELLEETGMTADKITHITDVYEANGMADIKSAICVAHGLHTVTDQLDKADGIKEIKRVPLSSIPQMVARGEITCASSIAAFLTVNELFNTH